MAETHRPKGLSSAISYRDSKAAFRWLEGAFGFEPLFVLLDADGNLAHSEMGYGASVVMIGNEWSDDHKSPQSIGGKNTQSVHVQLAPGEDIDAHCAAARAAGGENLAAADGRLAGAEAVTALAHEAARLIGALHRGIPKFSSIGATKKGRQARAAADRGADKRESGESQSPSTPDRDQSASSASIAARARRRAALTRRMTRSVQAP